MSPSLRGSGLKYFFDNFGHKGNMVSLFTREWIEIENREQKDGLHLASPSLRGSGLKYNLAHVVSHFICLPLYEGVD